MNKLVYILFAVAITFSSCEKDSSYVGVWEGDLVASEISVAPPGYWSTLEVTVDKDGSYIGIISSTGIHPVTMEDLEMYNASISGTVDDNGNLSANITYIGNELGFTIRLYDNTGEGVWVSYNYRDVSGNTFPPTSFTLTKK